MSESVGMSEIQQSFVMHFGEMGSRWGINRTVGQIYALLMVSEAPLNADQIMDTLRVSRGNVSMGLKELQAWQLVKVQHTPGERKDHFAVAGDVWQMGLRILEERRKREVDPTLTLLRDLIMVAPSSNQDGYAQAKIQEIHDLLEMLSAWSKELQHMNPDSLRHLMKLGAGVGKVLELKNKWAAGRARGGANE